MEILNWQEIKLWFPKRNRDSNKSDFGHILVIGGDYGMGGAVRMAAEAAMRTGAGLVSVATQAEQLSIVSGPRPEIMCHSVKKSEELAPLFAKATVCVVGPGLGTSQWSRNLLSAIWQVPEPKIVDADGLNLLAENPHNDPNWILTPHPGEASRLLKCTVSEIQQDRIGSIQKLQKQYGGVVVLKGQGTLVYDGSRSPKICPAGNPGMSSGGMGDVLSGVIGGLVAQGFTLTKAAQAGVLIHSMAADYAAKDYGERGLIATDLFPYLRVLVNNNSWSL
ncbi:MAG: NAD(P)H-hydrate dehydratase [Proteobacteria bacterium]|nr:NAD(P)H-hydrate dehydratase [Pseudomonadota bacterium]